MIPYADRKPKSLPPLHAACHRHSARCLDGSIEQLRAGDGLRTDRACYEGETYLLMVHHGCSSASATGETRRQGTLDWLDSKQVVVRLRQARQRADRSRGTHVSLQAAAKRLEEGSVTPDVAPWRMERTWRAARLQLPLPSTSPAPKIVCSRQGPLSTVQCTCMH